MLVKDLYEDTLRNIMKERGIEPLLQKPGHIVSKTATFEDVLQYTDAFLGKELNTTQHYRYSSYIWPLHNLNKPVGRLAHVDIGCGAGPFSWAFVDWAIENGIDLNGVTLYGLDHSPAMVKLAQEVRAKVKDTMLNYPALHCYSSVESLLRQLMKGDLAGKSCVITFGYVLVQLQEQGHADEAISTFARVVSQVYNVMDDDFSCTLVAVDGTTGNWSRMLLESWELLLRILKSKGIGNRPRWVPGSAKVATLCPV